MNTYRLSHQAVSDLEEIRNYIAKQRPAAAERVLDGLHEGFQLLAENPLMGALREDLRPNLRVFPGRGAARNFVIFYYPAADGIEVSTVIHGARDYPSLFAAWER